MTDIYRRIVHVIGLVFVLVALCLGRIASRLRRHVRQLIVRCPANFHVSAVRTAAIRGALTSILLICLTSTAWTGVGASTSTFDLTNAAVTITGPFGPVGGWKYSDAGGQIAFRATGTDCTILGQQGGWSVVIDGGAPVSVSGPGSDMPVPIFTGLADAPHDVIIRQSGGGGYFVVASSIAITGAAPAIALCTDYGPYTNVIAGRNAEYMAVEGGLKYLGDYLTWSIVRSAYNDSEVRFRATDATKIRAYTLLDGSVYVCSIDGVDQTPVATQATGGAFYGWTTLATGISGGTHTYKIKSALNPPYSSFGPWISAIMPFGGSFDTTFRPVQQSYLGILGDSILAGAQFDPGTPASSTNGAVARIARSYPTYSINNVSIGGNSLVGWGQTDAVVSDVLRHPPKYLVILLGANDINASVSAATYQAAVQNTLQKLIDGVAPYPGLRATTTLKIVWLYQLDGVGVQRGPYNAAVDAAIAAVTVPAGAPAISSADTTNSAVWPSVNVVGDMWDSLHPKQSQGMIKLATAIMGVLNATPSSSPTGRGRTLGYEPKKGIRSGIHRSSAVLVGLGPGVIRDSGGRKPEHASVVPGGGHPHRASGTGRTHRSGNRYQSGLDGRSGRITYHKSPNNYGDRDRQCSR